MTSLKAILAWLGFSTITFVKLINCVLLKAEKLVVPPVNSVNVTFQGKLILILNVTELEFKFPKVSLANNFNVWELVKLTENVVFAVIVVFVPSSIL